MLFTSGFESAFYDYQYLLEKKYTEKNIVKLVGDRYKLNTVQRSLLYRGVSTKEMAKKRKEKNVTEKDLSGEILYIDTYNLLLTINSYLKGKPVFISYDSYVRDAGVLKARVSSNVSFNRPLRLAIAYLSTIEIKQAIFYIDLPVNNSSELKNLILNNILQYKLIAKVVVTKDVDKNIATQKTGVISTSDTEIIDETELKIFDLAKNALKYHFNAHFINLQNIVNKT